MISSNFTTLISFLVIVHDYVTIGTMEKNSEGKKAGDTGHAVPPAHNKELDPADYLRAVKAHLRNGKQKSAFVLLQQASIQFPEDPFILSYFGYFQSVVDKKHRSGVENCKKAITLLKKSEVIEKEVLLPVFYLNLGRAYVAGGKKKDAIEAFHLGLKFDDSNKELWKDLRGLGERKQPAVPFLDRSNPVNKYLGKMTRKGTTPQRGK
jgi:predicted Zn-dependent protease